MKSADCLAMASMISLLAVSGGVPKKAAGADLDVANESSPALSEIVVTAQKRNENLEDVPISVTAISGDLLKSTGTVTTKDLQLSVPSLVYSDLAGFAQPFMRGVGSDVSQPNSDPSVATYIDGAFVSFDQATIQNLLGVRQVEVLEGPQGTLYGRNAVGGAINVITLTPTQQTEGDVSGTFGNYASKEGAAHFSTGVTDQLAVGLYVAGSLRNRFITDLNYQPLDDSMVPAHEDQWGARLKAVYTPTDWLRFTPSVEATETRSFDTGTFRQLQPNALGYILYPNVAPVIQNFVAQTAFPTFLDSYQRAATLREEADLSFARILGISNYRNVNIDSVNDDNATGSQVLSIGAPDQKSQQYSQELQLLALPESKIQWIAGVYAFHELGGFFPLNEQSPVLFGPAIYRVEQTARIVTKSLAEFAQATVPLDPVVTNLRLTVGGRYTTDKKTYSDVESFLTEAGVPVIPAVAYPEQQHQWSRFTPKVTIDYRIGGTLLYATYSEGFKSGSYNLSTPSQTEPVNPEDLKSYEIGAKAQLWDRRINWNNAAYFYNWNDLQVQVISTQTGGATTLQNAAAARAYGLESSITAAATAELTLNSALSWEHTRYLSFANYSGLDLATLAPLSYDAQGNQLQRAPKWVVTTGAEYKKDMGGAGAVHASANWYFNDGFFWTPENDIKQHPYQVVNATTGFLAVENWDVTLWVKNLSNTHYFNSVLPIAGLGVVAQDAAPRTYGLTASYKWR